MIVKPIIALSSFDPETKAAIAAKDYDAATEAYKKAVPVLDRMADKGIIHKNKAARRKSRLNKTIKGLQA